MSLPLSLDSQYASWDLAFHMLPFAKVDPEFAKEQLVLFLREWYMAPNGQITGRYMCLASSGSLDLYTTPFLLSLRVVFSTALSRYM